MEQEDIVAQTEMLVVAKKLEDAYFKTREMTKHMVEQLPLEDEDDLNKCMDGYLQEKDPAPSEEYGDDRWTENDGTGPMMLRKGVDGHEAKSVELLMEFPPTLLRKRRRTGNSRYCLREVDGAHANVLNTGPVVAPTNRRRLNGRRRMVETNILVEDRSDDGPAMKMVVVEQSGCDDVALEQMDCDVAPTDDMLDPMEWNVLVEPMVQDGGGMNGGFMGGSGSRKFSKQGTIKHFLTKNHGIGMDKNGGGTEGDGGRRGGMVLDPKIGIGKTKLTKRLKSSVALGKKKMVYGAKSKTGKGLAKKWGGSDSSQPGIRNFLMEIGDHKNSGNGNSPGNFPDSNKNQ